MDEQVNELLKFFKALADANRLKIVGLLAQGEYTVEQMAEMLDEDGARVVAVSDSTSAVYREAAWYLYGELWRWAESKKPDLAPAARRRLLDRLLGPVHAADGEVEQQEEGRVGQAGGDGRSLEGIQGVDEQACHGRSDEAGQDVLVAQAPGGQVKAVNPVSASQPLLCRWP